MIHGLGTVCSHNITSALFIDCFLRVDLRKVSVGWRSTSVVLLSRRNGVACKEPSRSVCRETTCPCSTCCYPLGAVSTIP